MNIRQSATTYFILQGASIAALLLFFVPASRVYFRMGDAETTLLAFLAARFDFACRRFNSRRRILFFRQPFYRHRAVVCRGRDGLRIALYCRNVRCWIPRERLPY
jgi:hypothetical protein